MADSYVQEECTQICEGELLEDMVETVKKTGKMYCDVWLKGWFTKDSPHPLTYVPLWALSLPLKKGSKVVVRFKDGDINLPYLWKDPNDVDEGFYKKFEFPQGVQNGVTTQPKSKDTASAQMLGKDAFVIKTDDYVAVRQNDAFVVMSTDGKIYVQGSQIDAASTGTLNVDSADNLNVKSAKSVNFEAGQNVKIKAMNNTIEMGESGVTINNHLSISPSPSAGG